MAYNNTVILTGNIGNEARIHERENGKSFATVSIATTDSYQDEHDKWVEKDTIWHDLIIFSPRVASEIQSLKRGTRVKITGSLSYQDFDTTLEDGRIVKKKQASIIVGNLELAPLVKKS